MKEVWMMGSDQRVVRAARVSFGKDEDTDELRDKKLIRYLFKHKHASPFEHNIVAIKSERSEWLSILDRLDNPTVQIYYAGGYMWLNLRNLINGRDVFKDIYDVIEERFPTVTGVVKKGGEVDDEELIKIPYTRDEKFLREKIETKAGWVGLVDKLEIGTDMDYYTFIIECPLFVARQWHRHRFGSYNEISRRYTAWDIKFYIPEYLRKQASHNKQASLDEPIEEPLNSEYLKIIKEKVRESKDIYEKMVEKGIAKEIARGILPQFMMTRYYWTVPRISLDNFIRLRTHEGAQKEIKEMAKAIESMVGYKGTDRKNIL